MKRQKSENCESGFLVRVRALITRDIFYHDHKDKTNDHRRIFLNTIKPPFYRDSYFRTDYLEYFGKLNAIRNNLYGRKVLPFTASVRSTDDYKICFALEIVY